MTGEANTNALHRGATNNVRAGDTDEKRARATGRNRERERDCDPAISEIISPGL